MDPAKVVVTTLDADNRPDPRYFALLTYVYCVAPDPLKASYQPLADVHQQHLGRAYADARHRHR